MPASPAPEQSIGFLLADVSRLLRRDFDRRVRALELTQAQWRAIAHLAREDGIRQNVLADRLEVKPVTLGRLIDRMAAAGWVDRRPDPEDRRAALLFLTAKTQPILDQMRAHAEQAVAALMSGIQERHRDILRKTLLRMKHNLLAAESAACEQTGSRTSENAG